MDANIRFVARYRDGEKTAGLRRKFEYFAGDGAHDYRALPRQQ